MNGIKRTLVVLSLVGFGFAAHAESVLTTAKPEEVGLSSAQLKKIEEATAKNIDEGLIPGAVMLVARHGKLAWVSVQGKREPNGDAMKYDSIFRIYSMTKPMVTTALMQMVEEGRLQVSDPVSKFLPSMGAMKVGTEVVGADGKPHLRLADPTRPMTVQDLMRHTSGLVYGARGDQPGLPGLHTAKIGDRSDDQRGVRRAAQQDAVALQSRRSLGIQRRGRRAGPAARGAERRQAAARGAGRAHLQAARHGRHQLPGAGRQDEPRGAARARHSTASRRPCASSPMTARSTNSGGGGLLSTTDDYLRFTAALANSGTLNGKRIIGKQTLAFMTADHVGSRPGRPPGFGFGLGFEVRTAVGDLAQPGTVGEYGWSGAAGSTFWVDPKNELFAIYMIQANADDTRDLRMQFRTMVEAALLD